MTRRATSSDFTRLGIVLLLALGAVAATLAFGILGPGGSSATEPEVHGEAAAIEDLRAAAGTDCISELTGFLPVVPDLDAKVAAVGGPGHWLDPGLRWAGDKESVPAAFGARVVVATEHELWVEFAGQPDRRVQLRETLTQSGVSVWALGDEVSAHDPAVCKSLADNDSNGPRH